ncbi:MAG: hypothetical protein WBQ31_00900, partial [Candidatus Acidiferrales bacterium]
AWPLASCTTTRIGTRFTCDSKGTCDVRVFISGVEAAEAAEGDDDAGVLDVDGVDEVEACDVEDWPVEDCDEKD